MRALTLMLALLFTRAALAETRIDNACLGNAYESCFILIEGEIEPGLTDRLIAQADKGFDGGILYLNSPGGSLGEAVRLGRYIRSKGWDTSVGGSVGIPRHPDGAPDFFASEGPTAATCESACAYVFMAGVRRSLDAGNRLGLHQFYAPGQAIGGEMAQKFSGELVAYMVEMGVDARIFSLASSQESSGMYYVTPQQAEDYDLTTRFGYDAFFLEPYKSGLIAATKRLDPPQPYDGVDQLSLYCRGGQAYALLHASIHGLMGDERGFPILYTGDTDHKLPESAVSIRIDGAQAYLTVQIPAAAAQAMTTARSFAVGAGFGRVQGGDYVVGMEPTNIDRQMITAALRFCID